VKLISKGRQSEGDRLRERGKRVRNSLSGDKGGRKRFDQEKVHYIDKHEE